MMPGDGEGKSKRRWVPSRSPVPAGHLHRYGHHGLVRRVVGLILLVVLVGGLLAYRHLSDPARVRSAAQAYLDSMIDGRVTVQEAAFSLFGGIRLRGVSIGSEEDGEEAVFACSELRLLYAPLPALIGRLVVEEVVAVNPTLRVQQDAATGRYNLSELLIGRQVTEVGIAGALPTIRLRNANIQMTRVDADGQSVVEDLTLSVVAVPGPGDESYVLSWQSAGAGRLRGKTRLDLVSGTLTDVEGGLPWVNIEGVFLAAEGRFEGVQDWCDLLGLTGQVRLKDFVVSTEEDAAKQTRATVELRDARLSFPFDEAERIGPESLRYLRFEAVNGTLEIEPGQARARFTGLLHGSECELDVRFVRGPAEGLTLTELGYEARVMVKGLQLPARSDPARPDEARFVERWKRVRHFYRDYDPAGTVNLEFRVTKAPGSGQPVSLIGGRMEAVDCAASYRKFPYRVSGLTGTVHYGPEGLRLENLVGEHGGGVVTVNGTIREAKWYSACSLEITGRNIPLDDALHDALSPRHQAVWDGFELDGHADLTVSLIRGGGSLAGSLPWERAIDVEFKDLNAKFLTFAYPVEQLKGRLRIDSQGITISNLAGRCGTGRVVFNGTATLGGEGGQTLEMRLEAANVEFDERLYDALPADARETVKRFAPDGAVDITGRLSLGSDGGLVYDLEGDLKEVTLTYADLPIPVEKVSGKIRLTPQRVTVTGVEGRQGDTVVSVNGFVDRSQANPQTNLTIACRGLSLSKKLRDLLPADLARLWDQVRIDGPVDTQTVYVRRGRGQDRRTEQSTRVTARGVKLTYSGFPLDLTDVDLDAVIDGPTVRIEGLVGSFEGGRIWVRGEVSRDERGVRGSLVVTAKEMIFGESLRQALPWRLRRTWNHLRLTGRFDVEELALDFSADGEGRLRWKFAGRLGLIDAGFEAGVAVSDFTGSLVGSGEAGPDVGGMVGEADLDGVCLTIKGRTISDLTGKLKVSDAGKRINVSGLSGRLCGGSLEGEVEVDRAAGRYWCRAVIQGAELGALIASGSSGDTNKVEATGQVDSRLYLSGRTGDPDSVEGGGEVRIERARIFKLPMMLQILGVLGLVAPADAAVQSASADFVVQGQQIELRDIWVRDNTVAMAGSGRLIGPRYLMDLRLVAVSPHRWFVMPVLTELMEGAAKELVEIRVKGRLGAPVIRANPLPGVSGAMDVLLGGQD